jgi:excisionase family DNA binding protein
MTFQELYSVDQVASLLGLHVRTVRRYVREGRLKATRIGKQYRVRAEDLQDFGGKALADDAPRVTRRTRHVEVSGIVEIDAISPEEAARITNGVLAAANVRPDEDPALRIDATYSEERGRLKIVVMGGLATTAQVLGMIDLYLGSERP